MTEHSITIIESSGADGSKFFVTEKKLTFGSDPSCDVIIYGPDIEQVHTYLDFLSDQVTLNNYSSQNPTKLNGIPIEDGCIIRHGDIFTINDKSFYYESSSAQEVVLKEKLGKTQQQLDMQIKSNEILKEQIQKMDIEIAQLHTRIEKSDHSNGDKMKNDLVNLYKEEKQRCNQKALTDQTFRCMERNEKLPDDKWLMGTFAGGNKDIFFVKPDTALPSCYLQNKDVLVRRDSVDGIEDLFDLLHGDRLFFELKKPRPQDKTPMGIKPSAYKAIPSSFTAPRQWCDLKAYFTTCKAKVLELNTHREAVNSIMCCDAFWNYLFHVKCFNEEIYQEYLEELFDFIFFLSSNGDMDGFPSRKCEILGIIHQKELLNRIRDVELMRSFQIEFIRESILFDSSLMGQFLPIMETIESGSSSPAASLFLELLLKTANITKVGNWKSLKNVPTVDELSGDPLEHVEYLKPVKLCQGYENTDEYLDLYYRLVRVETFAAIQKGIKDFKAGALDQRDMNVYKNVTIVDINLSHSSILVYLKFKINNPGSSWKTSRKLMHGNLLCISMNGDFADAIWVTVADRDEELLEKHAVVGVELISFSNENKTARILKDLLYHSGAMIMVESPTFFKSFQYVLESLKDSQLNEFPLKDAIVHGKHEKNEIWCQEKSEKRWKNYLKDIDYEKFEESQKQSFWHALITPLAMIQGPPGTGKTFIGSKLIHFLLNTQQFGILNEFEPEGTSDCDSSCESEDSDDLFNPTLQHAHTAPILIMTYKNHALDELLKMCTQFCDKEYITRIGRQSKELDLESCLMFEKMKNTKCNKVPTGHFYRKIENLFEDFEERLDKLEQMKFFTLMRLLEKLSDDQVRRFVHGGLKPDSTPVDLVKFFKTWANAATFKEELLSVVESIELQDNSQDTTSEKFAIVNYLNNHFVDNWLPKKEKLIELTEFNNREAVLFSQNSSKEFEVLIGSDENDMNCTFRDEDEEDVRREMEIRTSAFDDRPSMFQGDSKKTKRINRLINAKQQMTNMLQNNFSLADFPKECVKGESPLLTKDLWELSDVQKYQLIFICLNNGFEDIIKEMDGILEEINTTQRKKQVADEKNKVRVLKTQKIIGATITGASINRSVIQKVSPRIVVIEEAAEVLEASLVAVLSKSVEKLILIGDHQQLKAQVETHHLRTNYNFHVSMMERLILLEYPFGKLLKQGRMRPELSVLLKDIYPDYKDFCGLKEKNKPIKCIPHTTFFWSHNFPEERDRSIHNIGEANMVVALAMFFVSSGVLESKITILCAYRGQLQVVRRLYRSQNSSDGVSINIKTIDEYQGDENDIIIISLTRSNKQRSLGFLKEIERRCVAQSRARCGMYFVGNDEMFRNDSTWMYLMNKLQERNHISPEIPIVCYRHPSNVYYVVQSQTISSSDRSDKNQLMYFARSNGSWCEEICNTLFECAIEDHRCKKPCTPRHDDDKCMADVPFISEPCGHNITRKCFMREEDVECSFLMAEKLGCGHEKSATCHEWNFQRSSLSCEEMCGMSYECSMKHGCPKPCSSVHSHGEKDCSVLVTYKIPFCGHDGPSRKACSAPIPSNVKCKTTIDYKSTLCGHQQKRLCSEEEKCQHPCEKIRPDCGHSCDHKCYKSCQWSKECHFCEEKYDSFIKQTRNEAASKVKSQGFSYGKLFGLMKVDTESSEFKIITDKCYTLFNFHANCTVSQIISVWKVNCSKSSKKFWEFASSKSFGPTSEELYKLSQGLLNINEMNDISDILSVVSSKESFEFTKFASGLLTALGNSFTVIIADVILGETVEQSQAAEKTSASDDSMVVLLDSMSKDSIIHKKAAKPASFWVFDPKQIHIKYIVHIKTKKLKKATLQDRPDREVLYNVNSYDLMNSANPDCSEINRAMALYENDCLSRPSYQRATRPLRRIQYVGLVFAKTANERYDSNRNIFKKDSKIDEEIFLYYSAMPEQVPAIIDDHSRIEKDGQGYKFYEHPQLKVDQHNHCEIVFRALLIRGEYNYVRQIGKGFCREIIIKDSCLFIPRYVLYF